MPDAGEVPGSYPGVGAHVAHHLAVTGLGQDYREFQREVMVLQARAEALVSQTIGVVGNRPSGPAYNARVAAGAVANGLREIVEWVDRLEDDLVEYDNSF